jgi:hypothetical protein
LLFSPATGILDAMTRFDEPTKASERVADTTTKPMKNSATVRTLEWEDAIVLVPDFTLDALASDQDHKYDDLCTRPAGKR